MNVGGVYASDNRKLSLLVGAGDPATVCLLNGARNLVQPWGCCLGPSFALLSGWVKSYGRQSNVLYTKAQRFLSFCRRCLLKNKSLCLCIHSLFIFIKHLLVSGILKQMRGVDPSEVASVRAGVERGGPRPPLSNLFSLYSLCNSEACVD